MGHKSTIIFLTLISVFNVYAYIPGINHTTVDELSVLTINDTIPKQKNNVVFNIGKSTEQFAAKVYQQLNPGTKNVVVSPVSMQTVLALTQTGANGITLEEMASVLDLPTDKDMIKQIFSKLLADLHRSQEVSLTSANKIYLSDALKLSESFRQSAHSFSADVEPMNVAEGAAAAEKVNRWIAKATHDRILDVIQGDDITADTAMILINALYFKGIWDYPFDTMLTKPANFFLSKSKMATVNMMETTGIFSLVNNHELDAQFIELPYTDPDFVMTVILPNKINGLRTLIENVHKVLEFKLPSLPVDEFGERMGNEIDVFLPKFTIESTIKFNAVLERLGMKSAFANADFSGITETKKDFKISKVIQKTFIEVNEKGTEAAAVSAVLIDKIFGGQKAVFKANHPFMFILKQKSSGAVLFVGQFASPHDS